MTGKANPNPDAKFGRLMIPNELDEAITFAPWRGEAQHKIVRAIVRMTYGWRQRTVRVSVEGIAERCNVTYSGAFRRALEDLVKEGVVIRPQKASGASPATYSINPDHEQWGRYSTAGAMLRRLFRERLPANDAALASAGVQMGLLDRPHEGTQPPPVVRPPEGGQSSDSTDSLNKTHVPSEGHEIGSIAEIVRPLEGTQLSCKSNGATSSGGLKDSTLLDGESISTTSCNSIERQTATTTTAAEADVSRSVEYAIGLTTAANNAITRKWGEQIHPMHFGTAVQIAHDLIAETVDLEVARGAIVATIAKMKTPRPPASINYFREPIIAAHRSVEQRALDEQERGRRSGGSPEKIATIIDPAERQRREQVDRDFVAARRAAAIAWGKEPANADLYARIVERARKTFDNEFLTGKFGPPALAEQILQLCENASGFPDTVDGWLAVRAAS